MSLFDESYAISFGPKSQDGGCNRRALPDDGNDDVWPIFFGFLFDLGNVIVKSLFSGSTECKLPPVFSVPILLSLLL